MVRTIAAIGSRAVCGTVASRLRMKWTRQRCHAAPVSTVLIACFSPSCASEITSRTPVRPRLTRLRRKAVQKLPSSEGPTSTPSTWRSPSWLTPIANTVAWLTTRPSTRTLW